MSGGQDAGASGPGKAAASTPSEEFTSEDVVRNHGWWTAPVGWLLGRGFWNTQIIGREHVPEQGPVIVASNHIGVADGPLVHIAIPRPPHIMTKIEMMRSRIGFFLRWAGEFPVDRKNGRRALQIALDLLKEGRVVALFPEGTRGAGSAGGIKAGVAWLAQHSGAPVVPTACLNTRPEGASVGYIPRFRARPYVVFGEPIRLPEDLPAGREGTARAIEIISAGLAAHITHAQEL
ncbi:MAG: lysophospholipid acyltransferase family protein, partial [bacterium]|nr:lysophospholipid acyltransferase family protein [bacterium]